MGIPDFVKFIARTSPGALCRVPKGGSRHEPLIFDFILIDATNAAQTLGLDTLRAFLNPNHLSARSAVIFALDSQRDRSGTARAHRHALVGIGDLDVQVQKLCGQLADAYRAREGSNKRLSATAGSSPYVLTSGRGVVGEADYKLLDLQRSLVTCAIASGAAVLPTFLFISEDSDVLCGALCGPAPQQVSIATKLQDVLFEPCILRLDRVLAFVATCTDAFYAENEKEAAAAAKTKMKAMAEDNAAKAMLADSAAAAAAQKSTAEQGTDEAMVRRRKPDGPMVATGVRIELADSSDDEQPEDTEKTQAKLMVVSVGATRGALRPALKESSVDDDTCDERASAAPTEGELLVSSIMHTSCVDMVFLFMIVMGNAINVPPLVRGATKVDAGSCWRAYCKLKYRNLPAAEAETGRALLTTSVKTHSTNKGSLVLNCHFLHSVLDAVHYAGAEPRPPVEEEKNSAITYLSNAVYATLRYIVGCNLDRTPALQQTFLDSRPLSESATVLPSLSAVMWVLGQEEMRTFSFPLHGLAKKELLAAASGGILAGKDAAKASARFAPIHATSAREASSSAGDLEVGDHLVAPAASNAWSVSGARPSNISLATLMQNFTSRTEWTSSAPRSGSLTAAAIRPVQLPSVTELVKKSLQKVSPGSLAKGSLLFYLMTVWTYALGLGVRRMATFTKAATSVAEDDGSVLASTLVQPPTLARTAKPLKGASGALPAGGHYVYSFELRRMAPVLQTATVPHPSPITAAPEVSGSAGTESSTALSASGKSAVQQAMFAALGMSFDYSKTPHATGNVMKLPRSALNEDDVGSLQRLKKVAKKKCNVDASVDVAVPIKKHSDDADEVNSATSSTPTSGTMKHGTSKAKKRLGRRERLKQLKTIKKVAAAAASGGAPRHAVCEGVSLPAKTATF
ncbi:conserved hypothetical protein [Leishmania braziliensis MHOM/BR/75/M2904]|uniref:Uncharacterized protein n=2 Tax=Leishmania braziliensis TaxID=5660 RepID=A4HP10_LEIBR|nr:conserved hypothetical protein [Leishmania braziliensis MHOM/BR/75/M2904]CAJ2481312.1 unnamed protein product [Leishmania braziliensis]CAM43916.1 conserved hypothetical protein [Leishmania braziliensis MHOM/BR/75/M2904]SYZ69971.1 hypothetical_protein [Leishmania braziliensis MHOM/BR/75/M2904]